MIRGLNRHKEAQAVRNDDILWRLKLFFRLKAVGARVREPLNLGSGALLKFVN